MKRSKIFSYAILAILMLLAVFRPMPAQALPTPTSFWPADGTPNDAVDGNNGVLQNGAGYGSGITGQAFSLDGVSAKVSVSDAHNLHISGGDFTILAWAKFNAISGDMSIVDKMSGSGLLPNMDGWRLLKQADDHLWFCFGGGSVNGCGSGASTTVRGSTLATTGVWYCVAATKTSTTFSLYVNGVQEDSKATPSFTDTNAVGLTFGSYPRQGAYLNGLIDDVRIYGSALAASDVQSICSSPTLGVPEFPYGLALLLAVLVPAVAGLRKWTPNFNRTS